ncbi:histidinol-phosphate transaminase [Secundilactobacillus kimchicus]|nr:histidinol-phosphate transaminase [Secundilactobacillus kimchicus]MBT9672190.1 histidinol-phosphate transaminase [Secundilactobacillus kimchicus]
MVKPGLANLKPYVPEESLSGLKKRLGLKKIVRLSANENAYGTSPKVKQALLDWQFEDANRYPDAEASRLRTIISEQFGISQDRLVFGNGLDEIIELLSRTLLVPGDTVIQAGPTFSEYGLHALVESATVVEVPVDETGTTDLAGFLAAVTPTTKLIWLCNPNNPTGTYLAPQQIEAFLQEVPKTVMVVVDEAYIDFVTRDPDPSVLSLTTRYENLVVLRTFSKAYGLANFRVGYAVVPEALASVLQTVRLPYNLSSFAEIAASAAFADQAFVDQTTAQVAVEREKWLTFLAEMKLEYDESQANFVYFRVPDAQALSDRLMRQGYLIRTGLQPEWLRISIGQPQENQTVRTITKNFLEEKR